MSEVWLHSNRRILCLALAPVALIAALGWWAFDSQWLPFSKMLGSGILGISLIVFVELMRQLLRPRIAFSEGDVLFYLRRGRPIAVPLQVVEAFFQGEGPAHLPGNSQQQTKSVNLIARLAQRETDWQRREVKSSLGNWSEGYVTIRGTWCEPITGEVIRRLNRRLGELTRAQKSDSENAAQ